MEAIHTDVKDSNGCITKPFVSVESDKAEDKTDGEGHKTEDQNGSREHSESQSLLSSQRKPENKRRKVQWNDRNGNKLAEVLIYEPSEVGGSDDEDDDPCFCTIS